MKHFQKYLVLPNRQMQLAKYYTLLINLIRLLDSPRNDSAECLRRAET